jgi:biofilm PGA synthesis N-glycosyltransferase PgaC
MFSDVVGTIELSFIYIIVILGIINAIRMTFCFILGDIYDHTMARSKSNRRYMPLVSIVVAAYNEEKVILRTLMSLSQIIYKRYEIIVIDDGSKDKTSEIVKSYINESKLENITLVRQANGGKAVALNNGIKNFAKGSLIMTLDADSIIANDAVQNAVNYFKDDKVAAVASNVRIIKSNTFLGIIQYIEYLMAHRLKKAFTVLNNEYIAGGIGSTFRKSIMKKVGYYDTDTITEDIDLTMKILRNGNKENKVIFGSDVICLTESVLSLKDLYKQRFRWKYGRFQTMFKNKSMFLNRSAIYTKRLTFLQLPFVIYSELAFLMDLFLITFVIYISFKYHETSSLLGIFAFLAFYSFIAIISDEYLTIKEKINSIFYIPFAYLFFFVISIVEYIALLKSIRDYKGIVYAKEINKCGWEHVERAELTTFS